MALRPHPLELFLFSCGLLLGATGSLSAQFRKPYEIHIQADGLTGGDQQTPFWLRANEFGLIPLKGPAGIFRAGASLNFATALPDSNKANRRKLDWGLGVEGVQITGPEKQFVLPEAYAKLRYGRVELWGGRRKEFIGITDTTLTSGSIVWSNNALPIPKIQIGTAGFIPLKFLNNFVALKGSFAHGWFDVPYIQGAYLHYKSLHGRFGKPGGKVAFYFGINHMVQWGGHAEYLKNSPVAVNGHLTTAPKDFLWGILLGQLSQERENDRFTGFDGENRVGNHLGNYDIALTVKGERQSLLFYHQHIFEDLSGLLFLNHFDGLYGLSWSLPHTYDKSTRLNKLLFEFLTTNDQAGSTFDITARFQGGDNYFNHSQYVQGWSYYDKAIGTPLLPLHRELANENLPHTENYFPVNRVTGFHLAGDGLLLGKIILQARLTYTLNRGTYSFPFPTPAHQFSSLLLLKTSPKYLHGLSIAGKVAYDQGDLYHSRIGAFLSLSKTWKNGK
ncbi:capsule assembly Wzi family protein [Siphonobacter sp. SORGH_AS_1065]|uniref:capsule assembly Wzi family protein n=1 Tax=Siphonobacter sp. SORGH_AS_1065 TaxID=3041795 RepID=UPI00278A36A2|nr:capsule assembly Wzi family protein [Siphonobacter sp. SORGH_AS_1065]MDQ1087366.1 hypothetical protein [Siphonobacter sp. SORGH_AS_1065]